MAQWVRVPAALPEGQGSVPNTYIQQHAMTCNSIFQGSQSHLLASAGTHILVHALTQTHR